MSVKLKNQIVRAINAAIGGALPAGVKIEGRLKDRRIWIDIKDAPFNVMKPENITVDEFGVRYSLSIMSGPEKDHTAEGCALLAQVKELVKTIYAGPGVIVHFDSAAYVKQARRPGGTPAPAAAATAAA